MKQGKKKKNKDVLSGNDILHKRIGTANKYAKFISFKRYVSISFPLWSLEWIQW